MSVGGLPASACRTGATTLSVNGYRQGRHDSSGDLFGELLAQRDDPQRKRVAEGGQESLFESKTEDSSNLFDVAEAQFGLSAHEETDDAMAVAEGSFENSVRQPRRDEPGSDELEKPLVELLRVTGRLVGIGQSGLRPVGRELVAEVVEATCLRLEQVAMFREAA